MTIVNFRSRGRYKLDESKNNVRQVTFDLINDPNFKKLNYQSADKYKAIFKDNVNYIINIRNLPVRTLFRTLNVNGLNLTMNAWIASQRSAAPNLLLVVTFARILEVTPSQLLDPDLPNYYEAGPTQ